MAIDTGWIDSVRTAVASGNHEALAALCSSTAADEEEKRKILGSLLSFALECKPPHMSCFQVLLDHNAEINCVAVDGMTPLHHSAKSDMFLPYTELLITKGANLEARNQQKRTPLLVACSQQIDAFASAEYLLENGAYVNAQDLFGESSVHYACRTGCEKLLELLLKFRASTTSQGIHGETPLHAACFRREKVLADLLLKAGSAIDSRDFEENTPLMTAVEAHSFDCFYLLITEGANLDARNSDGKTALHFACEYPDYVLFVQTLISAGAKINLTSDDGETPLHVACLNDNSECLEFLIKEGAYINARGHDGETPLHVVCDPLSTSPQCLEILLGAGADPNITTDDEGSTPLHALVESDVELEIQETMVLSLLEHGADIGIANIKGETAAQVAYYSEVRKLLLE